MRVVLWHVFIAANARLLDPEDEAQQRNSAQDLNIQQDCCENRRSRIRRAV